MWKTVNSRPVRLSGRHIQAVFANCQVEVANISVTGALLIADQALPVGQTAWLALKRGAKLLKVQAQIVRVQPAEDHGRWYAAIVYTNLTSEMRRTIPSLAA